MTDHIKTELNDGVLSIRFNRPDKKNALTQKMYAAMADALSRSNADDEVRVVFLAGTAECFCAGNDLGDFLAGSMDDQDRPSIRFINDIATAEKPIVAAVGGAAIGVGMTMLLHCDLVYAAPNAKLHFPFVNLAIIPEAGSTYLLPRMVGHQRAAELFLLGEPFDAPSAREFGIVNDIFPADELIDRAYEKACTLARKAPTAVRQTKALMKGDLAPLLERVSEEVALIGPMIASPEAREVMSAFMEKREPDFSKAS
ncbi:MAG: enoyl-CoA hydratase [Rhodospirillales bacterium]|nr:enoyl-CoA hydratase [Rhodospirillales bacterium]